MSQVVAAPSTLVRISVLSEDRRLDIGIPGGVPLVELTPGFARSLGVLDPTLAHGGYALRRADGTTLDASLGATAQGVHDGELLTLVRGGLLAEPRVYDDVTEAVIDATTEQHRAWTARDNSRTALAVSLTFLGLCAVLLLSAGSALGIGAIIAGGGAVVLLVAAAVLGRLGQQESGHALGLAAAVFAALGGFLAVPGEQEIWGWPLAAAALGAVVAGGAALALTPQKPEINLIPVAWGAVIGVPAVITALIPGATVPAYAMMIAIVGVLGNGLPWLALSSTRIKVISPQSDQEVFAPPSPIDAAQVKERAASGARVLNALRIALGLAILLATPLVAASGVAGAVLTTLAFIGMMFQSRQAYARGFVLIVMAIGAIGLAVTGLTVSASQEELRPILLVLLLVTTAVLVTLTLLTPRARLRLARVADTVEVLVLALLLPFGVLAAGWA